MATNETPPRTSVAAARTAVCRAGKVGVTAAGGTSVRTSVGAARMAVCRAGKVGVTAAGGTPVRPGGRAAGRARDAAEGAA